MVESFLHYLNRSVLASVDLGVEAAEVNKLTVGARFDYPALVYDDDDIGVFDSGEPMGDDE